MNAHTETEVRPALLDINGASAYLGGIGRTRMYELFTSGALKPVKIGRRTFVARHELDRFVESLASGGALAP